MVIPPPECPTQWQADPRRVSDTLQSRPSIGGPICRRLPLVERPYAAGFNLGVTRMAEACSLASYRQLAWTAAAGTCARKPIAKRSRLWSMPGSAPTCCPVPRSRCVQLGRPALPDRRPRRGRGRAQGPLRPHSINARLYAPLGAPSGSRSRPPARPPMSSTACSIMRPT